MPRPPQTTSTPTRQAAPSQPRPKAAKQLIQRVLQRHKATGVATLRGSIMTVQRITARGHPQKCSAPAKLVLLFAWRAVRLLLAVAGCDPVAMSTSAQGDIEFQWVCRPSVESIMHRRSGAFRLRGVTRTQQDDYRPRHFAAYGL